MLKYAISLIIFLFLSSCLNNTTKENENTDIEIKIRNKSSEIIGESSYTKIQQKFIDTVASWKINKIKGFVDEAGNSDFIPDTLIAINTNNNRLVTCILFRTIGLTNPTGGISFYYGERINHNNWYFFGGPHVFVPFEMKAPSNQEPFSYQQLHEIALKEVYGGYLNEKGEINEAWFTSQFEGQGWGDFEHQEKSDWILKGKRFKTKKEFYEFLHLEKVRNNWLRRDTTKPIIQLQPNL